jgi:glycosyltransferase involved in cell wall biosynthesis
MRVSVVIPVYNGEEHLREALESVFGQTHRALEIVVVDDGSTDGTNSLLEDYTDRVLVIHQENAGVSRARNRGVEASSAPLVAFLDQDDLWYEHKLERQVEVFSARPGVSFVYSDLDVIDASGRVSTPRASRSAWARALEWICPLIGGGFHPFPSTVMMKRDVFLQHGGFCSDFVKNLHEDVEFWARLSLAMELTFIDEPLVKYRYEEGKWGREGEDAEGLYQNTVILCRSLMRIHGGDRGMRRYIGRILRHERRKKAVRLVEAGRAAALRGDRREARRCFREGWGVYRGSWVMSGYVRSLAPSRWYGRLF